MTIAFRTAFALSLAILACVLGSARATRSSVQPIRSVEERCESVSTQFETLVCYLDAGAKSRAEVERSFRRNLRAANAVDKDFNVFARREHILGSFLSSQLKTSQAAWLRYSKAQCAYEGGSSFGGSGTDILDASCHCRLNSQRLAELKAAGKYLDKLVREYGLTAYLGQSELVRQPTRSNELITKATA